MKFPSAARGIGVQTFAAYAQVEVLLHTLYSALEGERDPKPMASRSASCTSQQC